MGARGEARPVRSPSLGVVLGCVVLVIIAFGFLLGASIGACLENVQPGSQLAATCDAYETGTVRLALLGGPVVVVLLSALGANGWVRLRVALLALAVAWCVLFYSLNGASNL